MELIDKDALMAEIEKRFDEYSSSILKHYDACTEARASELGKILTIVNSLEVKEIDMEKEKPKEPEEDENYIDLGLPSGTLWKSANEDGYYTYDEATKTFGSQLPSEQQWAELEDECKWEWVNNGYVVTGPNGKSILLPAAGYRSGTEERGEGVSGDYWSSESIDEDYAWFMYFRYSGIYVAYGVRSIANSVRLVK